MEIFPPVLLLPPILTALHESAGKAKCIFSESLFLFGLNIR